MNDSDLLTLVLAMIMIALPSVFIAVKTDHPNFFQTRKYWQALFYAFFFFMILILAKC